MLVGSRSLFELAPLGHVGRVDEDIGHAIDIGAKPVVVLPDAWLAITRADEERVGITFIRLDARKVIGHVGLALLGHELADVAAEQVADGVAQRLVVMKWMGGKDKKAAPVALVGKGVTFDTGGISLGRVWPQSWTGSV